MRSSLSVGVEAGEVDAAEAELENVDGVVCIIVLGDDLLHFVDNLFVAEVHVVLAEGVKIFVFHK